MPRPRHHASGREAAAALARIAPLVTRWIERLLAAHVPPLTLAQYLVLQAVDDGDAVGSELARRAAVSPAAISQLLAGLEFSGLVERRPRLDDRRRQPLALTAPGRAALQSAHRLVRERIAELLGGLRGPEADALARLLERLDEALGGTAPPRRPPRPRPPRPPKKR